MGNRYHIPGHIYHLTHRCHIRQRMGPGSCGTHRPWTQTRTPSWHRHGPKAKRNKWTGKRAL